MAKPAGAWAGISAVALALGFALLGCTGKGEQPVSTAKPGDLLVLSGKQRLELVQAPRGGTVPNSLLGGVVRLRSEGQEQLYTVNAVCSMPNLPGWPTYDNLYGRELSTVAEAKNSLGKTSWQVLFHYDKVKEEKMGRDPGPWTARLRDNMCRRGDFDDRPKR
jgi:alkylated DNA repair dioxygenase AlkB